MGNTPSNPSAPEAPPAATSAILRTFFHRPCMNKECKQPGNWVVPTPSLLPQPPSPYVNLINTEAECQRQKKIWKDGKCTIGAAPQAAGRSESDALVSPVDASSAACLMRNLVWKDGQCVAAQRAVFARGINAPVNFDVRDVRLEEVSALVLCFMFFFMMGVGIAVFARRVARNLRQKRERGPERGGKVFLGDSEEEVEGMSERRRWG